MTCVCRAPCNTSVLCPAFRCSRSCSPTALTQAPKIVCSHQSAWPVINWALRFLSVTWAVDLKGFPVLHAHDMQNSSKSFARLLASVAVRHADVHASIRCCLLLSVHQATCDIQRVGGTSLAGLCVLNSTLICDTQTCMHDVCTEPHNTIQNPHEEASASCGKSSGKRRCSSVRVSGSSSGRSVRYRGSRKF